MTDEEKEDIYKRFKEAVNMSASEIDRFLKTKESKSVGQIKQGESESIGRQSGKKIIKILTKYKKDLNDDDYTHMKKVISYVARHTAQGGPTKDKEHSAWRYSLKNWGHDPLKS